MQARFRIGSHDVLIGRDHMSPVGKVELVVKEDYPRVAGQEPDYIPPGQPFSYGPDQAPFMRLMMSLSKGEARAIASAIMGAAAEL